MNKKTDAMEPVKIEESVKAGAKSPEETGIRKVTSGFEAAWNKHDGAAMAAYWMDDGELFNPSGQVARGRKEVARLFTEEQTTYMAKTSFTYRLLSIRFIRPDVAVVEKEAVVDGMQDSNGAPAPTTRFSVFTIMVKGRMGTGCMRRSCREDSLGSKNGKLLLRQHFFTRASESAVRQYFPYPVQSVQGADIYSTHDDGPDTALILIETTVRRVLPF